MFACQTTTLFSLVPPPPSALSSHSTYSGAPGIGEEEAKGSSFDKYNLIAIITLRLTHGHGRGGNNETLNIQQLRSPVVAAHRPRVILFLSKLETTFRMNK
jgi:hypothetical protein